jgi:hypothetical protein
MYQSKALFQRSCLLAAYLGLLSWSIARAETPAEACNRLAGDSVQLTTIDGPTAAVACSAAAAAAPQDSQLQFQYARALERSGQTAQARTLYQWLALENFPPADAAMKRVSSASQEQPTLRASLARRFDAVASIAKHIVDNTPTDHDDPNTVLAATGKDASKILAWVKANTHIVPYPGMLRGPAGVLQDRAGNSLDRALFLADLLHRCGINARIARQELSAQSAEALRQRFDAPWGPVLPVADKKTLLSAIGTNSGFSDRLIEQLTDADIAARSAAAAQVLKLRSQVMPALLQSLGNDPQRDAQLKKDAVALLKDHFWVQQQTESRWEDLDPDGDIVGPLVAAQTFLPSELPTELQQRVTLTLSIETLAAGKFSETRVLHQGWLPSQLMGQPITIVHMTYPPPIPSATEKAALNHALLTNLSGVATALPGLIIGGNTITGQLYSFDGKVADATQINLAAMGGASMINSASLSKGIASVFGESSSSPSNAAASSAAVVAEWLDIEIAVPGQPVRKERRAIFDLVGANKRATNAPLVGFAVDEPLRLRRALALQGTVDVWVGSNAFGPSSATLFANRQLSSFAAKAAISLRGGKDLADIPGGDPVNPVFWSWNALRQQSAIPLVFDRPNIVLFWRKLLLQSDQTLINSSAFDIVGNGVATDTHFNSRVDQGVYDTAAEFIALNRSQPRLNTAAAYAADISGRRTWSLISTASQASPALNPAAAGRIAAALRMGDLAIAPEQAGPAGTRSANWWRVEATGTTLGIGVGGMGADVPEYSESVRIMASSARAIRAVGCAVTIGFSYALDNVGNQAGQVASPSFRTVAEGALCVAGIFGKVDMIDVPYVGKVGVANGVTEWSAAGINLAYTLLTSPPDDPTPNASYQPVEPPPVSQEPVPICSDDGC